MTDEFTVKGIERAAAGLALLLRGWAEQIFGPGVQSTIVGNYTWADAIILACFIVVALVLHGIAAGFLRRKMRQSTADPDNVTWQHAFWNALGKPLYLLIWIYAGYFAATPLLMKLDTPGEIHPARQFAEMAFDISLFLTLLWAIFRFTRVIERLLAHFARRSDSNLDDLIVPLVGRTLRILIPVLGVILGLPLIGLSPESDTVIKKISGILIIGCVAWVLFQSVKLLEKYLLGRYDIKATDNLEARKVYTQVSVISKALYFLISIFTVASMLMLFEEVRRFGTSILASAGVLGIIIGFAAQRTIANLFAGFQLALTQPIRIDDVVIVESEWGRVEEVTLTYVVVKIWDQRRLIVPLSYFIEKPFQNWTRVSAEITGSVFLYADYTLPLDAIRAEVKRLVEAHPDWNRKFWNVQVTDTTERAMQVRILVTAENSGKAWNMRCDLREQMIAFLQKHHKGSLPKTRAELQQDDIAGLLPPRSDESIGKLQQARG